MRRLTYANVCSTLALGLVIAAGAPALADSLTEPDAYALRQEVLALQETVDQQQADVDALLAWADTVHADLGVLDDRTGAGTPSQCLATSDYHYVRERVNGSKRRYRLPLVAWNMATPSCRPDPRKLWRPSPRLFAPLHLEVPRAAR